MSAKFVSILFIVIYVIAFCNADNYSKDSNRINEPGDGKVKFRHKQVNKVWDKANRKGLHESKLSDLRRRLKRIDEKYLQLKKELQNEDGASSQQLQDQERVIDKHLEDIMRQFAIIPSEESSYFKKGLQEGFHDKKVNSLWLNALKNSQFTKEELELLRKDLLNHQQKIEDFNDAMKTVHGTDNRPNEVLQEQERKDPLAKRAADIDLKLKHKEITRDFQHLSVRITPEELRGGFSDHKVIQLWQEAEKTNFTAEELLSIKEELKIFEKEIARSDELHHQVLTAEKDHFKSKNLSAKDKDKQKTKEKKNLLSSTREELQTISRKVSDFMRGFKEKLGKVGRKQEL